jgi:hypothetical protein
MNTVMCKSCDDEHDTKKVEFLDIEENVYGQDVMTYLCPITANVEKSMVYCKK